MSNGKEINERLEFQERIKVMESEERTVETALMVYDLGRRFDECIDNKKKVSAISGGISGAIIAGIIALIEYFRVK